MKKHGKKLTVSLVRVINNHISVNSKMIVVILLLTLKIFVINLTISLLMLDPNLHQVFKIPVKITMITCQT